MSEVFLRGAEGSMKLNIFVFGSNLLGIHGRGAALDAFKHHGARKGVGIGMSGNSYAIPTKETPWKTLQLKTIEKHVNDFIDYAEFCVTLTFNVTPIGCGLAGYNVGQIAPMFHRAAHLTNINLPPEFIEVLSYL